MTMKTAKKLFKQHNMKASRIACQLLIKRNETVHYTDITCETDVIHESEWCMKISFFRKCFLIFLEDLNEKRPAPTDDSEEEDERPCTSRSIKRRRISRS